MVSSSPRASSRTVAYNKNHRLVEYFLVVSSIPRSKISPSDTDYFSAISNENDTKSTDSTSKSSVISQDEDDANESEYVDDNDFQPVITSRYPLKNHEDNPLDPSVSCFCHPTGNIHLRVDATMPKVHHFVSTGGKGQHLYGTVLTIFEPHTLPKSPKDKVYLPKCLCILSFYPFLIGFQEFLTQLNRLMCSGEMPLPVERYIVNFCSEIPAPPPGSFEVQTTIGNSIIKFWSPTDNQPIPWVSLPFSNLFQCLDIANIITIWHAMSLERQILFTSTQLSLLTICQETLRSLLFPMQWSHAYIPVIPHFLVPILSAPMPYLCGIDKFNLPSALLNLSPECIVVDLDMNSVTFGPSTLPVPPIPKSVHQNLSTRLSKHAGMTFREARCLSKSDDYSDHGIHLKSYVKEMSGAAWEAKLMLFDEAFHLFYTPEEMRKNLLNGNETEKTGFMSRKETMAMLRHQSQWDGVQEAFLSAFVVLLRNYRKYLQFPSKEKVGMYGGAGFRSKPFVNGQKYDMQPFLKEFVATQMFDAFLTKRLYGSGEADVTFFDKAVDKLEQEEGGRFTKWRGAKKEDKGPLLQSSRGHWKLKTIVPPEPSGMDLPIPIKGGVVMNVCVGDEDSVGSTSTGGGSRYSYSESTLTSASGRNSGRKGRRGMKEHGIGKFMYEYETFPEKLNPELFGVPRPLPTSVLAEFEKQREDAGKFRRRKPEENEGESNNKLGLGLDGFNEGRPSPEIATFTLFFRTFTAVVGKELLKISSNPHKKDKTILSTYSHEESLGSKPQDIQVLTPDTVDELETTDEEEKESETKDQTSEKSDITDSSPHRLIENNLTSPKGVTFHDVIATLPKQMKPVHRRTMSTGSPVKSHSPSHHRNQSLPSLPKNRFHDTLSSFTILEAKVTARAQLGLAFDILNMMRMRELKADPEAFQCLIDACGRCGDTERATQLLSRMHEDGIVADGVVYACLVNAFSADNAWKKLTGQSKESEHLPEWANGASVEMDWNKLRKHSYLDQAINHFKGLTTEEEEEENENSTPKTKRIQHFYNNLRGKPPQSEKPETRETPQKQKKEKFVSKPVLMQILLGENLLELTYPDISIDTDNEACPRCQADLLDDDITDGWTPNPQDYTTACPNCTLKFVPHFCVQSSSPTFLGSRGPSSPLFCERLSPWVLQKELRSVINHGNGIEDLLSPEWRKEETKNATLWWNLVLSFMRYRLPFSFLLQGSFGRSCLIAPTPEDEE